MLRVERRLHRPAQVVIVREIPVVGCSQAYLGVFLEIQIAVFVNDRRAELQEAKKAGAHTVKVAQRVVTEQQIKRRNVVGALLAVLHAVKLLRGRDSERA